MDCHRTNNGAYNPLERLDALRELFFAEPGKTLGSNMPVKSAMDQGLPENVTFNEQRIAFSVVNVGIQQLPAAVVRPRPDGANAGAAR
ncbi:hypothetical protein [Arthrobacter sp. ISL-28]|uniref:hypothetical protein n=1 Tax=Arthrobacter sp. ISL-28 TaxID=2819108 RepID=UPI001BEAF621|nr:hypothetical protein [Arthrobacter sp. ISL-28]MBT2520766.1 hypothetical protein [Arthrobacter sp. ISL-28]